MMVNLTGFHGTAMRQFLGTPDGTGLLLETTAGNLSRN